MASRIPDGSRPRLSRLFPVSPIEAVRADMLTLVVPSLKPRLNFPVILPTETFLSTTATLSLILAGADARRDRVVFKPSCTASTLPEA